MVQVNNENDNNVFRKLFSVDLSQQGIKEPILSPIAEQVLLRMVMDMATDYVTVQYG